MKSLPESPSLLKCGREGKGNCPLSEEKEMALINGILVARGLNKRFGGLRAVSELNLEIQAKKITALIGPNGAGKTTFFNLVGGIFPADSGEITFDGKRITGFKPHQIAQIGITRTFQTLNNFPGLSVFENVRAGIITRYKDGVKEEQEVQTMLEHLEIVHLAQVNVSDITPVARRLVEVGRSLIARPKLVLFDEVMAGFNEGETAKLIDMIRGYSDEGVTFCIIGHTMRAIMDISDHIIVMHEGTKYAEGRPEEIQKSVAVRNIYFGE